jgi:hypothetical protein
MLSEKKRRRSKKKDLRPLEPLFRGVKEALIRDLAAPYEKWCLEGRDRGGLDQINVDWSTPYTFKRVKQLANFDKRVIWSTDKSFDELSKECFDAFLQSQQSFGLPEPLNRRETLVLQKAGEICDHILGPFSYDDWFDSCSFGKRAAVDLPRSQSYLDTRFKRISGTPDQWIAFNHALSRDVHLLRAVRKFSAGKPTVESVKATAVPKSFKAARIIAPDTILGGFLSRGLGSVIRSRLERNTHINLASQQEEHVALAKLASKTGHLATIDMSKASDSFVWRHIEYLVPKDWHEALRVCRTNSCTVDSKDRLLNSYMLMGSGHTFPLQTLLFYCLAEATRRLLQSNGKVSVYGDDIIVPCRMAKPFIKVMSALGFVINSEKSFYDLPDVDRPSHTFFRESCGGDFKGGVDVRPYMPECDLQETQMVPCNEYVAWCHKLINGLTSRWEICEVSSSLLFLLIQIEQCKREINQVPSWEVDHAGVFADFSSMCRDYGLHWRPIRFQCSRPMFRKLVFHQRKRARGLNERPYYWYCLQIGNNAPPPTLYDSSVSLTGEPRKDLNGTYKWKLVEPIGAQQE